VRQGGVFVRLYADILIGKFRKLKLGCYLFGEYYGCLMHADDILLMSHSVSYETRYYIYVISLQSNLMLSSMAANLLQFVLALRPRYNCVS